MKNLEDNFRDEYERSMDQTGLDYIVEPVSDEEYKKAVFTLFPDKKVFVDGLLETNLHYFDSNIATLKADFPEGLKYCLTVMPCTEMGSPLPDEAVYLGRYLFLLRVRDGVTENFAGHKSRYFDLLPDYIRENCSFEIEWNGNNTLPNEEEARTFREKYVGAFNNLKGYFKD